ncbi:hypothetical protein LINGRAHAP2_LOCUS4774, partial [Linum grandiflorum]
MLERAVELGHSESAASILFQHVWELKKVFVLNHYDFAASSLKHAPIIIGDDLPAAIIGAWSFLQPPSSSPCPAPIIGALAQQLTSIIFIFQPTNGRASSRLDEFPLTGAERTASPSSTS